MVDPYNWHFPQRNQTMFMATIESSLSNKIQRDSSFLRGDIPGSLPKRQIPITVNRQNFSNSAYIQPRPEGNSMKNKFIQSNSLITKDIQYAQPMCSNFKTARIVNPLAPRYKLPYAPPTVHEPPRQFLRNTLDISDIQTKPKKSFYPATKKADIQGSHPAKLFKTVEAIQRLSVKDINKDGQFISNRRYQGVNPLDPVYSWREDRQSINYSYGGIDNKPKQFYPTKTNRKLDFTLNTNDIEGAKANSSNQQRYFFSKRKQYRDINNTSDIAKTHASSLNKGIVTNRNINPLMPQYNYPHY